MTDLVEVEYYGSVMRTLEFIDGGVCRALSVGETCFVRRDTLAENRAYLREVTGAIR